jgi:hypothetical protein
MKLEQAVLHNKEIEPYLTLKHKIEPFVTTKHSSIQKIVFPDNKTFLIKEYHDVEHGSDIYRLQRHPDILSRHEERMLKLMQNTVGHKGPCVPTLYATLPYSEKPKIIMEYIDGKDDIQLLSEGASQDFIIKRLGELISFEQQMHDIMKKSSRGNAMNVMPRLTRDIQQLRKKLGSNSPFQPKLTSLHWNYTPQHGDIRLQHHIENEERAVWIDFEQAGRYPQGYSIVTYTSANKGLSRLPYDIFNEVVNQYTAGINKKHVRSGVYSLIAPQELALCASTLHYPKEVQQLYLQGQTVKEMLNERISYAHDMLEQSLSQGNLTRYHRLFQGSMMKIVEDLRKNL